MKFISFSVFIVVIAVLFFQACDSATDSKSTGVATPVLVQPSDTATNVSLSPVFKWTGNADKLLISTNANFDNPRQENVSGNEFTLPAPPLSAQQTYFWKAGATSGSTVYWSTMIWRFRTGN
ncbi:MAG: hypothetical protein IT281_08560 [Ignavibacteria bacterium]|nr:hypothetical protein [Ignavibacteria bacterium]MCC7159575.1 hypothetical protein [Ignavibacteria bacterium]